MNSILYYLCAGRTPKRLITTDRTYGKYKNTVNKELTYTELIKITPKFNSINNVKPIKGKFVK
jgi:hypothetical protein